MQNKRLFTTEMDFSAVDKPPIFLGTVKQLDGVTLKITPLAGYNPMTMIGVTPKLYAKKPNGEFVYQDVDIDVDLSTSQMTIQCKNFMFSDVGTVEMEIELYDDDNYLRTSPTFEIDVTQKLNQLKMEDLKEGIHISLLEELMDYVAESKDYVERFKELLSEFGDDDTIMLENLIVVRMMLETLSSEVDRLENTIEQAQEYEFEMANQEIARVAAEEKRVEAEVLRVQAETNRVNEEAKRRTTEQARVSAENTRVNNENTREANEVTRKNNEIQRIEAETQRQSRYNSFITDAEANANNFENYTNSAKVKEEERKSNELDRKSQEDRRVSNEVERISNENTRKANEVAREKNETSRQNIFENKVDEVDEKIVELNTTKDNFVSSVNAKVDNKISEIEIAKSDMTTTVSNKVNEVETRFNRLTSQQQQSSEVIDARDGEVSLKARLDRDIEKAKQVYVNVEGSYISTDSSVGYAKDVEILGNTIQDASNLADIRSVGGKVEGQELYEIPVVSCGKNLFDGELEIGTILSDTGQNHTVSNEIRCKNYIKIPKSKSVYISYAHDNMVGIRYYDSEFNYVGWEGKTSGKKLDIPDNASYIRFKFIATDLSMKFQLEEGTQATPYEPYQEDKITILSPTPLEKVGDVADRIVCKDGVWGVEKNVDTVVLDGSESWRKTGLEGDNTLLFFTIFNAKPCAPATVNLCISDKLPSSDITLDKEDVEGIYTAYDGNICIRINKTKLSTQDEKGIKAWLQANPTLVKYQTETPTFIPLPHDQQVKLRTFANKTNISFLTEIEGTIKAQVPKSVGSSINTHTEQINNLNKELDRVKKLEESTVSTVTTESDFTTVEATSNGYFEDVKLEGKTLVNLWGNKSRDFSLSGQMTFNEDTQFAEVTTTENVFSNIFTKGVSKLKPSTLYTIIVDVEKNTFPTNSIPIRVSSTNTNKNETAFSSFNAFINGGKVGRFTYLARTIDDLSNANIGLRTYVDNNIKEVGLVVKFRIIILEGDHTQNPPSYFEGLKSVGDGVDEIVVSSVKGDGNLFDGEFENGSIGSDGLNHNEADRIRTSYTRVKKGSTIFISFDCEDTRWFGYSYDKSKKPIERLNVNSDGSITLPSNCEYVRFRTQSEATNHQISYKNVSYTPHQTDKKRLLYYNNETQTWEKPILRQWDSIEKHADGKYYYHQRSGEVVLNGSENITYETLNNTRYYNVKTIPVGTFEAYVDVICDRYKGTNPKDGTSNNLDKCIYIATNGKIFIKDNLVTDEVALKTYLQANNVTVVYQLAQEKVYECTNIDLITYANETNYIVESGAIVPKTTLKVHNNISNVVSLLQKKVSLLESNVKASQEVQDMMILETDMRMLDIELALMEFMPMKLNLGSSDTLRSATYFNFLKNHIINETYKKEYLENVMNKYLATNRLTQEEYDKLYKLLYPPVYDIELPIEY